MRETSSSCPSPRSSSDRPGHRAGGRARGRAVLPLAAAVASGALVALQQRVNGELKAAARRRAARRARLLRHRAGRRASPSCSPRPAARAAVGARARRAVVDAARRPRRRLASSPSAPPRRREIGVALLTVGLVAGQTSGGLLVDRLGLGPGRCARADLAPRRRARCCAWSPSAISVLGEGARDAEPAAARAGRRRRLPHRAAAGAERPGPARHRRRRRRHARQLRRRHDGAGPRACCCTSRVAGLDVGTWPGADQWWLYTGGPMGATFVAVAAAGRPRGSACCGSGLAVIAGQLIGGARCSTSLCRCTTPASALLTVVGVALTLVAVGVSGLGGAPAMTWRLRQALRRPVPLRRRALARPGRRARRRAVGRAAPAGCRSSSAYALRPHGDRRLRRRAAHRPRRARAARHRHAAQRLRHRRRPRPAARQPAARRTSATGRCRCGSAPPLLGIATVAAGSALYLGAHLGPGPRDGLMVAIHLRTGWRGRHRPRRARVRRPRPRRPARRPGRASAPCSSRSASARPSRSPSGVLRQTPVDGPWRPRMSVHAARRPAGRVRLRARLLGRRPPW